MSLNCWSTHNTSQVCRVDFYALFLKTFLEISFLHSLLPRGFKLFSKNKDKIKTPLWRHHNGILWQGIWWWFAGQGDRFQAYLISSQSEFRAFRTLSFLGALFHVLAPFRSLTITLFTSLVWTNFQHFPKDKKTLKYHWELSLRPFSKATSSSYDHFCESPFWLNNRVNHVCNTKSHGFLAVVTLYLVEALF